MDIYVGNLAQDVTEGNLRQLFESKGQVKSVKIIKDRFSGKSKGFGFVEMFTQSEGLTAVSTLNNTELNGLDIKVNEARPRYENRHDGNFNRNRY